MARKGKRAASRRAKPARKPARAVKRAKAARPKAARPKARTSPPKSPKEPRAIPTVRPGHDEFEEETVCSIEFLSDNRSFVARLDTQKGGMREHKAPSFTDLLELVAEDLREEFLEP